MIVRLNYGAKMQATFSFDLIFASQKAQINFYANSLEGLDHEGRLSFSSSGNS